MDTIPLREYTWSTEHEGPVEWDVRLDAGLMAWFTGLAEALQDEILANVGLFSADERFRRHLERLEQEE